MKVQASGAEIRALAMSTRTVNWASMAKKIIIVRETLTIFSMGWPAQALNVGGEGIGGDRFSSRAAQG